MLYALLTSYALSRLEGMEGCGRKMLHFVAGKEATEVERGAGKAVVDEPATHAPNHRHVVVDAWDEEVGEFQPHASLLHGEDGVEDGLETATADSTVDVVAERLQVDIGGIEIGQEVGKGLETDVARRDKDVPESCLMGQTGHIGDIFQIGERLGIGVGDAWAVVLLAEGDKGGWCEVIVVDIGGAGLRNVVVLTVQAAEVAACAGQRQAGGAWMEMVEGFLLDRVDGQSAGLAISLADEHAATIVAAAAKTSLAVGYAAVVRTELTLDRRASQLLVIPTFHQKTIAS